MRLHDKDNKLPFDYAKVKYSNLQIVSVFKLLKEIHSSRFRNEMVKFLSFQKEEFIRDIDQHVDPSRLTRVIPGLKKKNARKVKISSLISRNLQIPKMFSGETEKRGRDKLIFRAASSKGTLTFHLLLN